jgi:hypothetical protein
VITGKLPANLAPQLLSGWLAQLGARDATSRNWRIILVARNHAYCN